MQAGSNLEPILIFSLDQVQPWPPLLLWNLTTPLSTSPSHLHHWTLVTMTRTSPCPCSPCITMPPPLSGHLSPAPPCPLASSHSPESARHEPRRLRAPHWPERVTPRRAQTRTRTPERARRTPRARPDTTSPLSLASPRTLSLRHQLRNVTSNAIDMPTWPREPCTRRHGRRHPPRARGREDDDERHRPSFSPQSRPASPPGRRLLARVITRSPPPL